MTVVTRFAPSPTGRLHLGHAFAAFVAHDLAAAHGGRFLARIEDIDQGRARAAYEQAIHVDLAWLGLTYERPVRRQSEHMADYAAALDRLIGLKLVYRCFRTRRELAEASLSAPHGQEPAPFVGAPLAAVDEAERLARGEPFAWRFDSAEAKRRLAGVDLQFEEIGAAARETVAVDAARLGDAVLARKDCPTSYHLACVHDDAAQGVTVVTRGEDLRCATHLHRALQALLGLPAPRYWHHPLVRASDGRRLAKRDHAETLEQLRIAGWSPQEVRQALTRLT